MQHRRHEYEIEVDSQDDDYDGCDSQHAHAAGKAMDLDSTRPASIATATPSTLQSAAVRRKGRGFSAHEPEASAGLAQISHFDTFKGEAAGRVLRSVEGWVIFVRGLNEEVCEEDVQDKFAEYGKVRDVRLNLDHRTGYVKGYALVEFTEYEDAASAIRSLNDQDWLGHRLSCDFAFARSSLDQRRN